MTKIAFPQMGDYYIPATFLLSHIFPKDEIIKAPKITSKTIEVGTEHSPEFVCTPFKYTLGTMIECIEKGAETLIQMGGGCRYGYYAELQEKILKDLGYKMLIIPCTSIKGSQVNPEFEMDIDVVMGGKKTQSRLQLSEIRCVDMQRLDLRKPFCDVLTSHDKIIKYVKEHLLK